MPDKPLTRGSYLDELFSTTLDRRRFLLASGGVSLAGILAACAGSTPSGTGTKYDTMNVAIADLGTQTPDPMYSFSHSATYAPIALNLGEQLVRRGYDGKLTPALAESWTVSDDHLTWTFNLRSGVKMHDGSKFTAADVQTSIKRVQDKGNAGDFVLNENLVSAITSVKIIDDLHISITTSTPYFRMLDDLPIPVATAYYQSVGEVEFRKKPMAAGPYKFSSQILNQSMTFSRFDDFWDSSRIPNFKTLTLLILPQESARIAGLQAGSVDATNGLSPVAISQLKGANGVRILTSPDSELVHIIFAALNPLNPTPAKTASKVHDVRVRQAMLYALDREGMAKSILGGEATPVSTYGLPDTLGHDSANKPYGFDPAKAKQLLQDAGAVGFNFTLVSKSSDQGLPQVQDLCQAIVSNWQDVGIKAKYQPMEAGLQADLQDSHKFDGGFMFSLQGIKLYDPTYLANQFFSHLSDNVTSDDPKLDQYAAQLSSSFDLTARAALAKEYDDYLYATMPALGLFSMNTQYGIGSHVKDWQLQDGNGGCGPFWGLRSN
jgi:peptide/nickel transport system substrate-binding protein